MSLREVLRKKPIIHSIVSGIYRNTFYLLKTGYVKGVIDYSFKIRSKEIKQLKKEGFKSINPFLKRSWKFGGGGDNAYRRYYTALYGNKKVFIKIAKNDSTILNEINLGIHIKPYNLPFVCEAVRYNKEFYDDGTSMLANDYIECINSFVIPDSYEAFVRLCNDFMDLLQQLSLCDVVHADIHRNNLMMKNNGKLVLLDFGISKILSKENWVDYIARPGTYYRMADIDGDKYRIYDDAYSFCCLVESLGIANDWMLAEEYQRIIRRIGQTQFIVKVT